MYAYDSICIQSILEKNTLKSARPARRRSTPKKSPPPPGPLLQTRFSAPQLLRQFHQLLPATSITRWLARAKLLFYQRAFTPQIILWYLIFQRLNPNHHLSQVQEDALAGGADRLSPRGKPLSQQLHSEATTSYSDGRQRLPLQLCLQTLGHVVEQTHKALQIPEKFGLKVGLLDGSTCRLRPFGDIPKQFAPHRPGNAKKPPYWCLARVVGVFCWATGSVVHSTLADLKTSEQALAGQLLSERSWTEWLLVGDRNFGVYYIARAVLAAQAQAVWRLTEVRARKLARAAGLKLQAGLDAPITWAPSRQDQNPAGLSRCPVPGRLVAVRVNPRGSVLLHSTCSPP